MAAGTRGDHIYLHGCFRHIIGVFLIFSLTLFFSCGSSSDTTSAVKQATTLKLVAAITSPASNLSINKGDKVSFSGQALNGSGTYNYTWNIPGGSTQSATEQNVADVTFSSAGTYTVTLTVTDSTGTTAQDTVIITVSSSTTLVATITSPASNITVISEATAGAGNGDKVDFNGQASGGSGSYSYDWDIEGGTPRTAATASVDDVTFATAGKTYTVTFIVTDSAGNTATDTVTITTN